MNDNELVAQIKNRNANAFRFLVDRYKKLVWHMVLRMVRQHEDAEDLCQEVFLRVYRDIGKYRGESQLSTWIGAIAFNVSIDFIRKKGREILHHTDDLEEFDLENISNENPTGVLNKSTIKILVHRLIDEMPLQYRTVITLYHLEELSYKEIADITGMPEGTIKSYLNRGRTIIREKIIQIVPDIQPVLFETD
jgi:RNA polymerase sigma-70 factor (ECF subfamily)